MRKTALILMIVLLVICLVLVSGCFKVLPMEEVQACEFNSDCIQVYSVGCCKCPLAINSDYREYWDELGKKNKEECEGVVCVQCSPSKPIGTECNNNTCILIYSPIGIGMI